MNDTLTQNIQAFKVFGERLVEEEEAIKEAQRMAREVFELPKEKHPRDAEKAQGKALACSKGRGGNSKPSGPTEGPMARWLARAAVQG